MYRVAHLRALATCAATKDFDRAAHETLQLFVD